jgi:glyoxylase I family protein
MARIEHFALFADNLEYLKAFYVDALGLRVIVDNSKAPVAGYFLADERGCALEIVQRPPGMPKVSTRFVCHPAFWVDDYDGARAELTKRGAVFETDTAVENVEIRTSFFDDPDGNRVQIVWRARGLGE